MPPPADAGADTRPHVVVVGGGITGLATAWFLRDRARVTVLEADDRLGGKIRTSSLAGVVVEEGPDTFLARVPHARALAVDLGLAGDLVEPATGKAFVWTRGRLRPLPKGQVLGVPIELGPLLRSGVLSPRAVFRAGLDLVLPRSRPPLSADPTVAEVIGSRMGQGVVDRLVEPLVGGINAGRADDLSLSATAPQLAEAAASSRSLILGLRRRRGGPAGSAGDAGEPVTEKGAPATGNVTGSGHPELVTETGALATGNVTGSGHPELVTDKGVLGTGNVTGSGHPELVTDKGVLGTGNVTGSGHPELVTDKGVLGTGNVTGSGHPELVTDKGVLGTGNVTGSGHPELVTETGALGTGNVTGSGWGAGGAVFLGVGGGLGRLVDRLVEALGRAGVDVRTGAGVRAVESDASGGYQVVTSDGSVLAASAVVVTVPAFAAARLLRGGAPAVAGDLERIRYASVAVATLAYRPDDLPAPLDGSGFLVPRVERRLMTACTWTTSKWPALARSGLVLVRASAGRSGDDRPADLDDAELVAHLHRELSEAIGVRHAPVTSLVSRWPNGFPQYQPGHQRRVDRIEAGLAAAMPGVVVAGAAYRGLGIAACVRQAEEAAAKVTGVLNPRT